jgi:hypothetical protein
MTLGVDSASNRNIMNRPGNKGRPEREADLTAICEPIVYKMWEHRRLTTLWAFTACYRDSFTFYLFKLGTYCKDLPTVFTEFFFWFCFTYCIRIWKQGYWIVLLTRHSWLRSHRTVWSSGEHSCFLFEGSWVQISTRKPDILTEDACGFPQYTQANSGRLPQIGPRPLTSTSFQFIIHYHPTIQCYIIWAAESVAK